MKQKIIFINQDQFGYHIPTYNLCKYLKRSFNISLICWDFKKDKINVEGIKVSYVSRYGNIIIRNFRYLKKALKEIKSKEVLIIIKYFKGITTLLRLLKPTNKFVLDIRTGSVEPKYKKRLFYNSLIKLEAKLYKNKTIISNSLNEKMKLDSNIFILPPIVDIISSIPKKFNEIKLLYVGTLSNRNIHETLFGYSKFYKEYKDKIRIEYTIIGESEGKEKDILRSIIKKEYLSDSVNVLGEISYEMLKKYFDTNNFGVSYIPITDYYHVQPPIKTFEYLLSGMPVIATDTLENRKVINNKNGVLIQDNRESFYEGLVKIYTRIDKFDSKFIINSSKEYSLENIIIYYSEYLRKFTDP